MSEPTSDETVRAAAERAAHEHAWELHGDARECLLTYGRRLYRTGYDEGRAPLLAHIEGLKVALVKHGEHRHYCRSKIGAPKDCDCGLRAAALADPESAPLGKVNEP